tara:strand:+ start:281 stop:589 length:309 start_codon:yes stop_codon:yes gene_type:complete
MTLKLLRIFTVCLILFSVLFSTACKASKEIGAEGLIKFMNESSNSSFQVWTLISEDDNYYFIEIKTGLLGSSEYKVSKKIMKFKVDYEIPSILKFSNFDIVN